jgi:bla regulator protein blaR1
MIEYVVKTILCAAVWLLLYFSLLEKEKMHRFNRLYLLCSIAFCFIVPFITIAMQWPSLPVEDILLINTAANELAVASPVSTAVTNVLSWTTIVIAVYIVITLLLAARFARNMLLIFMKARRCRQVPYEGATIVLDKPGTAPHSFFHYIFLDKNDVESGAIREEILCHELAHIRQKHSTDVVLIELLLVFAWFNPLLWMYRRAIQLNHEFLADEAVVKAFNDPPLYQYLLIGNAGKACGPLLASRFNYLITKKRLIMITKTTSRTRAILKQVAVLPVIIIAVIAFADRTLAQQQLPAKPEPPRVNTVPSTQEGVSQELLDEYAAIVAKYNMDGKQPRGKHQGITAADKKRLETIFLQMSRAQQVKQTVGFMKAGKPFQVKVPTTAQLESWKDAAKYGVWIDDKKIDNGELDKYSNTDFDHVFVSKLSKNAKHYGEYFYQVNLMTKPYYKNYYDNAIRQKENMMYVIWMKKNAIHVEPFERKE